MAVSNPSTTPPTVDVGPLIEQQKPGRFWLSLFVVSWVITFLVGFDSQITSFAGRYIKASFELSDSELGMLGTVGLLGTLIGCLSRGYLGDLIGRRPSIMVSIVGFGAFVLLLALSQNYAQLVTLRFAAGFFLGGVLPLIWALNTEFAPSRFRSTSVGIIMLGYSLGSATGAPVSNLLIPRFGWQSVFVAGGIVSLLAVIPVALMLPESVKFLAQRGMSQRRIAEIMTRVLPGSRFPEGTRFVVGSGEVDDGRFTPAQLFRGPLARITSLMWIAYACSAAVIFYLAFWGPILNERLGYSIGAAATIAAATAISGAVGQLVISRFLDNKGIGTIAVVPMLAVPCLLLIGLLPLGPTAYIVVLLVANFLVIGAHGGMHSLSVIFYRPSLRANGGAWALSVSKVGAMLGPWLAGAIMDWGFSAQSTFFVFALFPIVMSVMLFALGRLQRTLPPDAEGALVTSSYATEPCDLTVRCPRQDSNLRPRD